MVLLHSLGFAGMGNLLKVLTREIENYPHFFLDFESKFKAWNIVFLDIGMFKLRLPWQINMFKQYNRDNKCFQVVCLVTYSVPFLFFRNQMGNLLKVLTCTDFDQGPLFFLDFESEQSLACIIFGGFSFKKNIKKSNK